MPDNDGWTEWSKHVLKELERLNASQETLRDKIEEVQQSITEMKSDRTGLDEVKAWKKEIDEVTSPTQLKELQKTVADLEKFKVKAMTIFVVLQTIFGIAIAILAL
jgi:predicted nuclease with TOPRIM domain